MTRRATKQRPAERTALLSITAPAPLAVGMAAAARMCGFGESKMWDLLRQGRGPTTFMLDGKRLVRVAELDRWLVEREKASA